MRLHLWLIAACLLLACSTHPLLGESNNDSDSSSQVAATESENSESTHGQAASCGRGQCKRQHGESGCKGNCKNSHKAKAKAEDADDQAEPDPVDQDVSTAAEDESANGSEEHAGGPPAFTEAIHALLTAHEKITREVTDIPNGIESVTTSDDPEVAALIRKHVKEMSERLENGQPVRRWDPLFRELFVHYKKIKLEAIEVEGGIKVRETSDDPSVVLLIRQHAHKGVSEFVRDGFTRAHQASPLPEGYVVVEEIEAEHAEDSKESGNHNGGKGQGYNRGMGQGKGMGMGMGRGRMRHQQNETETTTAAETAETTESEPEPASH